MREDSNPIIFEGLDRVEILSSSSVGSTSSSNSESITQSVDDSFSEFLQQLEFTEPVIQGVSDEASFLADTFEILSLNFEKSENNKENYPPN